jgi:hypothetical protein
MEYDERADELDKEVDRLEHESKRLEQRTEQARSEWESAKSDPSKAPGAQAPEATGPHNLDGEDPATGRSYGEERKRELEEVVEADSEEDGGNDST